MKIVFVSLLVLFISGCTDLVSYKDARNLKTTKIITPTPESEEVIVADLRGTIVEVEKDVEKRKDWNSPKETKTTKGDGTRQEVQSTDEVSRVETKDMSNELYWFFFSMMLMGMLGAGLIGMIEAIAERKNK